MTIPLYNVLLNPLASKALQNLEGLDIIKAPSMSKKNTTGSLITIGPYLAFIIILNRITLGPSVKGTKPSVPVPFSAKNHRFNIIHHLREASGNGFAFPEGKLVLG